MLFQDRDGEIIKKIYDHDGILSRRHFKKLYWPNSTTRAMERRLSKLKKTEYINWPSHKQRITKPIPEPICWLGWKGALYLAGEEGIQVPQPTSNIENQMRLLQRRLRSNGFHWLREPRWLQLEHDLFISDIRIEAEKASKESRTYSLEQWHSEGYFRRGMDVVKYRIKGREGKERWQKRGICPDGYFIIMDNTRNRRGQPSKARFLLELDMASHDNPSFGNEKVIPGAAYIKSKVYKERFGTNAGRWLVVTTGDTRMKNLIRQTKHKAGTDTHLFFFTVFDQVRTQNILTSPIWWQVGGTEPKSLMSA